MTTTLRHGAATDIGRARKANEDSLLVEPPLFAVADGMGGHSAGDVASQTAVAVLKRAASDGQSLAASVREANREVFGRSEADKALAGMGTTMTAILAGGERLEIAHVGDSRAYQLRNGRLTRLTTDHTVMERLVRQGRIRPEEARHHPQRSVLERALGVDAEVEVDLQTIDARAGDRVLLCTDGLTGMLDENRIRQVLEEEPDPAAASERLVAEAVAAGGHDNVSVIVVDYPRDPASGLDAASPSDTMVADEQPPIADPPGWSNQQPAAEPVGPPPPPAWSRPSSPPPSFPPPPPAWSGRPSAPPPGGPPPAPAPPPPVVVADAGDPGRTRRIVRRAVIGAVILVVVVGGGLLGRSALLNSWYVGASGDEVAIFRGVPGSILGLHVSELEQRTGVRIASLVEIEQERVREGKTADTRAEAEEIVRHLQRAPVAPPAVVPTAPPSPEPSPLPETPPA